MIAKTLAGRLLLSLIPAALCFLASDAFALSFEVDGPGGEPIKGTSNTTMTMGAAWRMEERADDLVGKSNLNPDLCGRPNGKLYYQSCQGLFRTQIFPAERLVNAPGQFS